MPGLAKRAPTAQEHSPKRIAQSEEVLLPVGKCAGGGWGVKQQGLVCDKEDKCQCWICFSGRQNCTVAILAQGTHWAVAVTQALLPRLDSHGCHFLTLFIPMGWEFEISLGLLPSRHFSVRRRGWQIGPRPHRSIPPRGSHSLKKFCCRWGNLREGGGRCQC